MLNPELSVSAQIPTSPLPWTQLSVTVAPAVSQNLPPPAQPHVTWGSATVPLGSLVVPTLPVVTWNVNEVFEGVDAIVQVPFRAESERLVHHPVEQPPPTMIGFPTFRSSGALVLIVATS